MANTGPGRNVLRIEIAGDGGVSGGGSGRSNGGGGRGKKPPPPPGESNPWMSDPSDDDNYRPSRGGAKKQKAPPPNAPPGNEPPGKNRTDTRAKTDLNLPPGQAQAGKAPRAGERFIVPPPPPGAERSERRYRYRNVTEEIYSRSSKLDAPSPPPSLAGLKGDFGKNELFSKQFQRNINDPQGGRATGIDQVDWRGVRDPSLTPRRKRKAKDATWKDRDDPDTLNKSPGPTPRDAWRSIDPKFGRIHLPQLYGSSFSSDRTFNDGNSLNGSPGFWGRAKSVGLTAGNFLSNKYLGMSLSRLAGAALPLAAAFAVKKASDYFINRGDALSKFSPDIVVGQVQAGINRLFADIREAQALGPGIGRLTEAESLLSVELREFILPFKMIFVENLANWVTILAAGAKFANQSGKAVVDVVSAIIGEGTLIQILAAAMPNFGWLRDWVNKDKRKTDDPFGIFYKMVQGVQLAPDGAGDRFSPPGFRNNTPITGIGVGGVQ